MIQKSRRYLPAGFFLSCFGFFIFLSFFWLWLPFPMSVAPKTEGFKKIGKQTL